MQKHRLHCVSNKSDKVIQGYDATITNFLRKTGSRGLYSYSNLLTQIPIFLNYFNQFLISCGLVSVEGEKLIFINTSL